MKNFYDGSDKLNLNQANFRFAFTFIGKNNYELKNDPRYVKMMARLWTQKDGAKSERVINYHKCTSEDWKEFYPVDNKNKAFVDQIKNDEKRGFFCLDWTDDLEIYGNTAMDS